MRRFLLGMLVGAVLVYGAQRYHLVRTGEGVYLIPKLSATFEEAYVDIRDFSLADWMQHKALAGAIVRAKKEHLMQDSAAESFRSGVKQAVEKLTDQS